MSALDPAAAVVVLGDGLADNSSCESDGNEETQTNGTNGPVVAKDPIEASYLVKRMSNSGIPTTPSGNVTPRLCALKELDSPMVGVASGSGKPSKQKSFFLLSQPWTMNLFVIVILFSLFCCSLYLVYKVHELQIQVNCNYFSPLLFA